MSKYSSNQRNFFQRVYELVSQVPAGRVVTYGQIAAALGYAKGARQVGWAMRVCPDGIPWHRVVNARGTLSTHPLPGGFHLQRALLEDEGIHFDREERIDLRIYRWSKL
ncbi:MAG: MGMT family protein [Chloroflexi bacterium]|nr:MGMT family protein [Chloroflexota bacterium]